MKDSMKRSMLTKVLIVIGFTIVFSIIFMSCISGDHSGDSEKSFVFTYKENDGKVITEEYHTNFVEHISYGNFVRVNDSTWIPSTNIISIKRR